MILAKKILLTRKANLHYIINLNRNVTDYTDQMTYECLQVVCLLAKFSDIVTGIQCELLDVTNGAAVEAFAAKIEKIDVLFNCAG